MLFVLVLGWGLTAFPVRLEARESVVSLLLAAPEECPSRTALVANILARTPEATFAERSDALAFRVQITRSSRAFAGSVETRALGVVETRRLHGATCAELVDAVALVIALTIDPEA